MKNISDLQSNYNFYLKSNLNRYNGQWVAIVNKKVISHSRSPKKAYLTAKKKFPNKNPFMAKVSSNQAMVL